MYIHIIARKCTENKYAVDVTWRFNNGTVHHQCWCTGCEQVSYRCQFQSRGWLTWLTVSVKTGHNWPLHSVSLKPMWHTLVVQSTPALRRTRPSTRGWVATIDRPHTTSSSEHCGWLAEMTSLHSACHHRLPQSVLITQPSDQYLALSQELASIRVCAIFNTYCISLWLWRNAYVLVRLVSHSPALK